MTRERSASPPRALVDRVAALAMVGLVAGCGTAPALSSTASASLLGGEGITGGPPGTRRGVPGDDVLRVRWRRLLTDPGLIEYKPQEFASASSDGERVFIGSLGGSFYALRPRDGAVLWHRHIDGGVASRPLYVPGLTVSDALSARGGSSGTVFVGGNDGALHALDAATGRERWLYRTKGPIGGQPVYDDGLLYFANGENRVYALDALSGAWRWQYEREAPDSFTIRGFAAPLAFGGRIYAGFSDGYLVALNARAGDVIWARSLAGDAQRFVDVDATPVIEGGTLYATSYSGGVYALDPADGSTRWRFEVEGAGSVRAQGDRIYFAAARAGLHCLDGGGHLVWRQSLAEQGELSTPVLVGDCYLLLSASEGGTYVVDRASGTLLQFFQPGKGVTAEPVADRGQVYLLTNTGFFYAFSLRG